METRNNLLPKGFYNEECLKKYHTSKQLGKVSIRKKCPLKDFKNIMNNLNIFFLKNFKNFSKNPIKRTKIEINSSFRNFLTEKFLITSKLKESAAVLD